MSFEYIHLWLQIRLIQNSLSYYGHSQFKEKKKHDTSLSGPCVAGTYNEFTKVFHFVFVFLSS